MNPGFDHEWTLAELLDDGLVDRSARALAPLLGGDVAISHADGRIAWGLLNAHSRGEPLIVELEAIGYLHSHSASPTALRAGRDLLLTLLRAQMRFKMASTLHLEAVAEDFESLKREHARLLESESRYRKLSEELEGRVRQQVAQLQERQQMLYEAEKLASVGQLAAGMAHEINNPLGFVRSNLGSFEKYLRAFTQLKAQLDPPGQAVWQTLDLDFMLDDGQALLEESARGLERIARIVADLKAFSNVDRASEEVIDVNTCIREAAQMLTTQQAAGISLQFDLLPLPGLFGLPGHLNQMFFNLLRNAQQAIIDAGRPGEIRISSEATEAGIFIRIQDNGIGMTDEQISHAFEPFYTTRAVGAGVGLGLATARNIALAHSGSIQLRSQSDLGSTATVFFPTPP